MRSHGSFIASGSPGSSRIISPHAAWSGVRFLRMTGPRPFCWLAGGSCRTVQSSSPFPRFDGHSLPSSPGVRRTRAQFYCRYVEDQVKQGRVDSPWEQIQDRVILGGANFVTDLKERTQSAADASSWGRPVGKLETIIACVEQAKQESWSQFRNRYGDGGLALTLKLAREQSGLTLAELARKLDLKPSTTISMTIKRYENRLQRDQSENKLASKAAQLLNAMIDPDVQTRTL